MTKFKIEWRGGSGLGEEVVVAEDHIVDGEWIVFRDHDGVGQIDRVRAVEVRRITRDNS